MAVDRSGGMNALDRLKSRYDDTDLTCSKCGYEDEDGSWRTERRGQRILYQHVCPSCGAIRKRTLRTDRP